MPRISTLLRLAEDTIVDSYNKARPVVAQQAKAALPAARTKSAAALRWLAAKAEPKAS